MKIKNTKDVKNKVYSSMFAVEEIDEATKELISDFGEMVINIGGTVKVTNTKKVPKTIKKPVFEADGTTPVLGEDGVTQKTEDVVAYEDVTETTDVKVGGDIYKKVPSEFPITRTFSEASNGAIAKEVAEAWSEEIKKRLGDEITKLRANKDDFSGEEEIIL